MVIRLKAYIFSYWLNIIDIPEYTELAGDFKVNVTQ